MNLGRSSLKLFAARLTGTLVVFFGTVLFARQLTESQLGSFFLFQALLGFLAIPASFGTGVAVKKRISGGGRADASLTAGLIINSSSLLVVVFGVLLFRQHVNSYLGAPLALYLAVGLVLRELGALMMSTLVGEERVGETAELRLTRHLLWIGVGGPLIVAGYRTLAPVYGLLAGLSSVFLWGLSKRSTGFERPTWEEVRDMFDFSKYSFVSSAGGFAYNWADVLIIGFLLTQADASTYEIAWRSTAPALLLSTAIAATVFPRISRLHAENDSDGIEKLLETALVPSIFLVIPAFVGALLFSEEILGLIFGATYRDASLVLIVLMGDKLFQAIQVILGRALQAINHPDLAARAAAISTFTNVLLNLLFVWQFGILGAAVATVIASLLNDALHALYLSRFVSVPLPLFEIGWLVVAASLMGVILAFTSTLFEIGTAWRLAAVVVFGVVVYVPVALGYEPVRGSLKRLFAN